ncbi:hypothetical protein ABZ935_26110 [Streptomyces coeruleorubidus]|uniref:hypothetical protein n=1 Tax=Streptomyces coeruleorubidus TaxID=116188 RepID=UPI0033D45CA6
MTAPSRPSPSPPTAVTPSPAAPTASGPWAANGHWATPEFATLEGAESVRLPSGGSWLAVTTETDAPGLSNEKNTYILDYGTDRLYEAMCRSQPVSLSKDRWDALFPHLEHRVSCAEGE